MFEFPIENIPRMQEGATEAGFVSLMLPSADGENARLIIGENVACVRNVFDLVRSSDEKRKGRKGSGCVWFLVCGFVIGLALAMT